MSRCNLVINYLHRQVDFWVNAEFYSVGVFAFAGVAVRVVLKNYFSDNIDTLDLASPFSPFMQIFYTQVFLVPNFLGCFIMSFCIANMKRLTTPLFKGITTGLCGCITSFATWVNGAVNLTFQNCTWYQTLIMVCLQFWLTWSAFTLGFMAAKVAEEIVDFLRRKTARGGTEEVNNEPTGLMKSKEEDGDIELGQEVSSPPEDCLRERHRHHKISASSENNINNDDYAILESGKEYEEKYEADSTVRLFQPADPEESCQRDRDQHVQHDPAPPDLESQAAEDGEKTEESVEKVSCFLIFFSKLLRHEVYLWAFLFWGTAIPLWAILLNRPNMTYFSDPRVLSVYRAVAIAPLGAWLRWGFARLPWIKAVWPEMNPQTFTANQIASLLVCSTQVFASNDPWTIPFNNGFSGSCGTVSTFFAELHSLYQEKGPCTAIRYGLVTFATAIVIIQIIRGGHDASS